jgi:predicted DNA-binding transcriptional regulator AlpA
MKRWITGRQLAQELGVSRKTVDRWRTLHGMPWHSLGPALFRYDLAEVEDWLSHLERERHRVPLSASERKQSERDQKEAERRLRARGIGV